MFQIPRFTCFALTQNCVLKHPCLGQVRVRNNTCGAVPPGASSLVAECFGQYSGASEDQTPFGRQGRHAPDAALAPATFTPDRLAQGLAAAGGPRLVISTVSQRCRAPLIAGGWSRGRHVPAAGPV